MKDSVFVDTSVWFAFVNRRDRDHARVKKALAAHESRLTTSNFVLDEVLTLARRRLGHAVAVKIGDTLQHSGVVRLIRATADDESSAWELFKTRPDQPYSFTDCVSFSMMKRLDIQTAAALDDDFRREGFEVLP